MTPGVVHETVTEPRPRASSGTAGRATPSIVNTRLPDGIAPVTLGSTAAVKVAGVLVSKTVVPVVRVTLEAPRTTVRTPGAKANV